MTSKKFFSLINGASVHIAPGTKVVDAQSVAQLMEAKEILDLAKQEAVAYRQQIAQECEQEREQARREGFAAGMETWAQHLAKLQKRTEIVREELSRQLAPVTISAAKKIVGREITASEDAIVDIVANNLKAVSQHKIVTIFVNPEEIDLLKKEKDRLQSVFDRLESLTIQGREDITPGSCIIETEVGIINAEIENQWRQLEAALEDMLGATQE